jgi:hypothetical protein
MKLMSHARCTLILTVAQYFISSQSQIIKLPTVNVACIRRSRNTGRFPQLYVPQVG